MSALPGIDRGLRIRRLLLLGPGGPFNVDFAEYPEPVAGDAESEGDGAETGRMPAEVWPLSVIAGRTNTGKTSILRFIEYVLGAKDFPSHREVLRQVRSAVLEVHTPDGLFTIERALEANRVHVYPGGYDSIDPLSATSLIVEPTSDPESISQFVLSTVGLQDVDLKEAPTQDESGVDRLSFRDLIWTCLYLNERVGSQQLLHAGNVMKNLKIRQVVDAIFGVHDNERADLARRVKDAAANLEAQRRALEHLTEFVSQQEPKNAEQLAVEARELGFELDQVVDQINELEARERAASNFASEMRAFRATLATRATRSTARVRDRVSQLDRFGSLRAQYADDIRKLTMLVEAENLFDQLSVTVCPACFSNLTEAPYLAGGVCSLCHTDTRPATAKGDDTASGTPTAAAAQVGSVATAAKELRAAKRRYKELDEYWRRLSGELAALREIAEADVAAEADAAARLDAATKDALSPFIAERTELGRRRQAALVQRSQVSQGIKLHTGLEARQTTYVRADKHLGALRKQQRDAKHRPDRDRVISDISARYRFILETIQYPKVNEVGTLPPYIDSNLVPYVRGQHFKEASSGGQVLVTLAWALAIFEVAYETGAAHPGVLMIDTPQKNLGGQADDTEFADIHLVEGIYDHVLQWLDNAGSGAQVIIVDNTPPANADDHIRVRYTRDPNKPPFGLIANEVGYSDEAHDGTPDATVDSSAEPEAAP
ncbi:hypothetical protein [Nocardioides alcanivorans]|uniref:hypothetical protein n=1 Tax=Nocardioides alcanivorans TaxID=2897352 RepID=UPI001F3044BD|nr:hypothetical protein [Nocardioides alcanivorans]